MRGFELTGISSVWRQRDGTSLLVASTSKATHLPDGDDSRAIRSSAGPLDIVVFIGCGMIMGSFSGKEILIEELFGGGRGRGKSKC